MAEGGGADDLVLRLRMAIEGDTAKSKRSAEKIATEVEAVFNEAVNRIRAMEQAGADPGKIATEISLLNGLIDQLNSGMLAKSAPLRETKAGGQYRDVEGARAAQQAKYAAYKEYRQGQLIDPIERVQGRLKMLGGMPSLEVQKAIEALNERAAADRAFANSTKALEAAVAAETAQSQKNSAIDNKLARDKGYLAAATSAETAALRKRSALDNKFASTKAALVAATQAETAAFRKSAAIDNNFSKSRAALTAATQAETAKLRRRAALDETFAGNRAALAAATRSETAALKKRAALDNKFATTGTALTAATQAATAALRKRAALDGAFAQSSSALNAAVGQQIAAVNRQNAILGAQTAQGSLYAAAVAQGKNLQAILNNQVLKAQIATGYAQEQATAKALQAQLNLQTQRLLVAYPGYAEDVAEAQVLQAQINNRVLAAHLAVGSGYIDAQVQGRLLQEQINARLKGQLALGGLGGIQADQDLADLRTKTERIRKLNDPTDLGAQNTLRQADLAEAEAAATTAARRAGDQAYLKAQADAAGSKRLEAAETKKKLLADANYIKAIQIEAATALESAALKAQATAAANATRSGAAAMALAAESKAAIAVQERVQTEYRRVVELRTLLGLTQAQTGVARVEVENAIQGVRLEETLNRLRKEEIALHSMAVKRQLVNPGGPGARGGGGPLGIAQGFRTTLRYGIASTAVFGVAAGITAAVKEAAELEKVLNQVQRQFESLTGVQGGGEQFKDFKEAVFDIAELTGQAADEVARVGFQLQGAFGGDTRRAIQETRSAIIATRVTGLELTEVIDAFTAMTQNFSETGLTIAEVSDQALQLQENLGVLAKETISFSADLAPVAAELGFTASELASLGAVAQKFSGRTGASLAEAYGRVLPQIRESGVEIVEIFSALGDTRLVDTLNQAFAEGDIQQAFNAIIGNYNRLSEAQQGAVIDLLGGRREAAAIIPILQNGTAVLAEYGKAANAEGKSIEYFNDLQETLQQRVARLGEEFKHMIQTLYESGLKDFFADFIDLLSTAVRLLESLSGVIGGVMGELGPVLDLIGPILQGALILRGGKLLGSGISKLAGGPSALGAGASAGLNAGLFASMFGRGGRSNPAALSNLTRGGLGASNIITNQAAQAAGTATAGSVLRGFSLVKFAPLGIAAAAALYSGFDNANRREIEKRVNKFGVGGVSPREADAVFSGLDLRRTEATGEEEVLRRLRGGATADEVASELRRAAVRGATGWEQALESLPGEMSKKIGVEKGKVDLLVDQVAGELQQHIEDGLAAYETDEGARRRIHSQVERLIEKTMHPYVTLADNVPVSDELDAIRDNLPGYRDLSEDFRIPNTSRTPEIKEIIERIKAGVRGGNLGEVANELEGEMGAFTDLGQEFVGQFITTFEAAGKAAAVTAKKINEGAMGLEAALAGFEAGTVGTGAVSAAFAQQISILSAQAAGNPAIQADLANAIKASREFQFGILEKEIDALTSIGSLTGNVDYASIDAIYTSALASGEYSIDQEFAIVQAIVENRRARAEHLASEAKSEEERDQILQAMIPLTELEQAAITAFNLNRNTAFKDALESFTQGNELKAQEILAEIVKRSEDLNISLSDATEDILAMEAEARQKIARAKAEQAQFLTDVKNLFTKPKAEDTSVDVDKNAMAAAARAGRERQKEAEAAAAAAAAAAGTTAAPGGAAAPDAVPGPGADDAPDPEDAENAARKHAEAQLALAEAYIAGDPVAEARIAQQKADLAWRYAEDDADRLNAQAQRVAADRQMEEALNDIVDARIALLMAFTSKDPVKQAEAARQRADLAYSQARGEAERIRAHAAQHEAAIAMQEAINDIHNAQIELLIAMADAAGKSVESAELAVAAVKQQIEQAMHLGVGEAEMRRLNAQLVTAQAGMRDATLQDRREYYQYLYDMEKITTGQLVNYLQSLLAIPDLTQNQIRDIEREIHNLRNQMGQDFQFNLPSNLDLPTLYEVRRFNQSSTDGVPGGYNDNRTISVQVNVATDASPDQIAAAVASAVGDPALNGTAIRKY